MQSRRNFIRNTTLSAAALSVGIPATKAFGLHSIQTDQDLPGDLLKNLPAITDEDYLFRQEQARIWMERLGVDAIFVEGGVNLGYFMGLSWWSSERLFGFMLGQKGDPIWICPDFEMKRATEVVRFGTEILTWHEHESPYRLLDTCLEKIGKPGGKVGIGPNVRNFITEGFRRDSRAQLVNGAAVTENVRAVKSEKEIQYLDVANRITKLAYKKGFEQLREGMSPGELGKIIRDAHTTMGVSGGGGPLFGENAAFPHGTKDIRNLREGDVILVDGGCSVNGYRSDVTRTIVFGKPSDKVRRVWDVVWGAQDAAWRVIRNGLPCEEADRAARTVVEKAGFGGDYQYFTHRLGHGIGLEVHEDPYLVRGNKTPMKTGVTFTNEPGLYLYGEFGIRIEDSFAVTENGHHNLGGMPAISIDQPFGA